MNEASPSNVKVIQVHVPGLWPDKDPNYSLASLGAGPHVPVLGHKQR